MDESQIYAQPKSSANADSGPRMRQSESTHGIKIAAFMASHESAEMMKTAASPFSPLKSARRVSSAKMMSAGKTAVYRMKIEKM